MAHSMKLQYPSPDRDDLISSESSSLKGTSPNFNLLGRIGATPFHPFSRTQRGEISCDLNSINHGEDLYAPDLLELDEFEDNERDCLTLLSPVTHVEDHEILSSNGVFVFRDGAATAPTQKNTPRMDPHAKLRSFVLSSKFKLKSYCERLYLHPKQRKRRKGQRDTVFNESWPNIICDQCEKMIPFHAWLEPETYNSLDSPSTMDDSIQFNHHGYIIHVDDGGDGMTDPTTIYTQGINGSLTDDAFCICTFRKNNNLESPETQYELPSSSKTFLNFLFDYAYNSIWNNEPLSIALDASQNALRVYFRVHEAGWIIIISCARGTVHTATQTILHVRDRTVSLSHPLLSFLGGILNLHHHMGWSGEVIVTGIQSAKSHSSISTGLGSSKLSAGVVNAGKEAISRVNTFLGLGSSNAVNDSTTVMNEKMIQKMSKVDAAAKVVSYHEMMDDALPPQTKQRVIRMMHYPVSLRPFVATISIPTESVSKSRYVISDDQQLTYNSHDDLSVMNDVDSVASGSSASDPAIHETSNTPFMCTPKSFPPTPSSRANVLAKGSRLSEDVIFLARDLLRLEEGLGSSNMNTRSMAKAQRDGRKLAVFNPADASGGLLLTRGRHCATKVGNDLYASVRGMIPILRNCHVYFELSISTPPFFTVMLHHASLSLGLSTMEMPLNALVGCWKGSVGLCSSSQILVASQWCSSLLPHPYSGGSTVGCLVFLDDHSTVETWDGLMATASVVFNVDGQVVVPAPNSIGQSSSFYPTSSSVGLHEALKVRSENNVVESELKPNISLLVPKSEELFPTLTLHSCNTDVLCRFSSSDLLAKSRDSIGAPVGVTIYGIDGTILFEEEADHSFLENSEDEDYDDGDDDDDDGSEQ